MPGNQPLDPSFAMPVRIGVNPVKHEVRDWLSSPLRGAIRWSDSGDALVWYDNSTVILREELVVLLEHLAPIGLPPAGPALLILAATRGKVLELAEVHTLRVIRFAGRLCEDPVLEAGLIELRRIANLPAAIRAGIPQRASLLSSALGDAKWGNSEDARAVVRELAGNFLPDQQPHPDPESNLIETHIAVAGKALHLLDAEAIELALRTGLEAVPSPGKIDLPIAQQVALLLEGLKGDPAHAPLVTLTRDIMAALSLPRAFAEPLAEASGGLGDIGMRGPLHRLLLSELAYDDDTLAARIALNEALYLRPEPTAQPPPTQRIIVIDSGIRLWGLPRVFAIATALACLSKTPKGGLANAYRASGMSLLPVPIHQKEGLLELLEALDITTHPGAALTQVRDLPEIEPSEPVELVLITHPAVLADRDFEEAFAQLDQSSWSCLALTVDREGNLVMQTRSSGNWIEQSSARLDLAHLLKAPASILRSDSRDLPALFACRPLPFGLPLTSDVKLSAAVGSQCVALMGDGSLWYWSGDRTGAHRFEAPALRGRPIALLTHPRTSMCIALSWHNGILSVFQQQDSMSGTVIQAEGVDREPAAWWIEDDVLLAASETHTCAWSLYGGALLAHEKHPALGQFHHQLGRPPFLLTHSSPRKIIGISWDGLIRYDTITRPGGEETARPIAKIFRCKASEDIYILYHTGEVVRWGEWKVMTKVVGTPFRQITYNCDHSALHLVGSPPVYLSLRGEAPSLVSRQEFGTSDGPIPFYWSVRRKFSAIARTLTGSLLLRAAKGYWVTIRVQDDEQSLCLQPLKNDDARLAACELVAFEEPVTGEDAVQLRLATFANGDRAWLDSRGILHLRANDRSIAELSIVLAESSSLPAWMNDGTLIGSPYFVGQNRISKLDVANIGAVLRKFGQIQR